MKLWLGCCVVLATMSFFPILAAENLLEVDGFPLGSCAIQSLRVEEHGKVQHYRLIFKRESSAMWRIAVLSSQGLKMMDVGLDSETNQFKFFFPAWLTRWRFPQWKICSYAVIKFYGCSPKLLEGEWIIGRRQAPLLFAVKPMAQEGYPSTIELSSPWKERLVFEIQKVKKL